MSFELKDNVAGRLAASDLMIPSGSKGVISAKGISMVAGACSREGPVGTSGAAGTFAAMLAEGGGVGREAGGVGVWGLMTTLTLGLKEADWVAEGPAGGVAAEAALRAAARLPCLGTTFLPAVDAPGGEVGAWDADGGGGGLAPPAGALGVATASPAGFFPLK